MGSNPTLSATQSAISAFSPKKSKMLRMFAKFVRFKGTGEAHVQQSAADLCSILSVEDRAGALRPISALTRPSAALSAVPFPFQIALIVQTVDAR